MAMFESSDFVWGYSPEYFLGSGAHGSVYRGANKKTGENVAVKILQSSGPGISVRELEVLRKLDHENIVKIIAIIEKEPRARNRNSAKSIIVMELCTGGSVLKILDDPENRFGLPEEEFLIFFEDFYKGIKYLRDIGYVHRDLKPANIMKFIGDDGGSVYKLIDFDAAKELADNETYDSLPGTEEYLDPYVYEHALMPTQSSEIRKFTASTDLWSIGVTIYHAATGNLPFRPFEGRKAREVMYTMISKKAAEVISVYQDKKGGELIQEKKLPANCLLSPALQEILCPLLANLMEPNPRKRIDHNDFFAQVQSILARKKIYIFFVNKVETILLYLDSNSWSGFQEELEKWTGVRSQQQILFFKGNLITATKNDFVSIPQTTEENPIILCCRDDSEIQFKPLNPSDHHLKKLMFPNMPSYLHDIEVAKSNCIVSHYFKRLIDGMVKRVNLIELVVKTINKAVISQLTAISKDNEQIQGVVHSLNRQFDMMKVFQTSSKCMISFIPTTATENLQLKTVLGNMKECFTSEFDEFQDLTKKLADLKPLVDSLLGSRILNRNLLKEWESKNETTINLKNFTKVTKSATSLLFQARASYWNLCGRWEECGRRVSSSEIENGEMKGIMLMDRMKLIQKINKLETLLAHCTSLFVSVVGQFSDWYKTAQVAFIQPDILSNDIEKIRESLVICDEKLGKAFESYTVEFSRLSAKITETNCIKKKKRTHEKTRQGLTELENIFHELHSSFEANQGLCRQLQSAILNQD